MDQGLSSKIVLTVPQVISISACIWLFRCYQVLRRKTLGLKMILILCISDFIFHVIFICNDWTDAIENDMAILWTIILETPLRFSLFWASNIAYLALKSLGGNMNLDPISYAKTSFIVVLVVTLIFSIISGLLEQTMTVLFITHVFPLCISLIWTTICYLKSISILKSYSDQSAESIRNTMKNLYIYSFVQIITTGPVIIYTFVEALLESASALMMTIVLVPVGFLGFANSLAYFFQRASSQGMAHVGKDEKSGSLSTQREISTGQISLTKSRIIL